MVDQLDPHLICDKGQRKRWIERCWHVCLHCIHTLVLGTCATFCSTICPYYLLDRRIVTLVPYEYVHWSCGNYTKYKFRLHNLIWKKELLDHRKHNTEEKTFTCTSKSWAVFVWHKCIYSQLFSRTEIWARQDFINKRTEWQTMWIVFNFFFNFNCITDHTSLIFQIITSVKFYIYLYKTISPQNTLVWTEMCRVMRLADVQSIPDRHRF